MPDLLLRVDTITEQLRPTPRGDMQAVRVVTYFVGEQGPFQLRVPAEGFDPAAVQLALEAEAAKIRQLLTPAP